MRVELFQIVLLFSGSSLPAIACADWPQFRGLDAGVYDEAPLPDAWGNELHLAWSVSLPGVGWSQPIVAGKRIFVTTAVTENQARPQADEAGPGFNLFSLEGLSRTFQDGGEPPQETWRWKVLCLDVENGQVIWEQTAREGRPTIPIHRSNTYASETPVTDGRRLIVYFGMTGLYCYDLEGQLLWNKELGTYPTQYGWGTGSSPILHEQRVYLQVDNEKSSFLVALDKETGDELWRVERDERSNWSTPFVWKNRVRSELVVCGGSKIRAYAPQTGKLLWQIGAQGRCAATPVADADRLYVGSVTRSTGRADELVAIRAGAAGDLSTDGDQEHPSVAWRVRAATPELASPLLYRDCLYTLKQHGGIVSCYDAVTGQLHYRQRLRNAGNFTSSPWANQEHVFCLDEKGQTFVLVAGPKFQLVRTNKLDDMFWSSPAAAGERLLLRGVDRLYCLLQE